MTFSDTSTKLGIIEEIDSLCDTDSNSYTTASKTRRVNTALEEIEGKLIVVTAGDKWHFGDSNFTSLPTGLKTMTNSTEAYQLAGDQSTTGIDTTNPLLTFLGASVKDNSGIWHVLQPISLWKDLLNENIDPAEHFKTDGRPQYYELREDFIVLYPAPDNAVTVTLTNGLKVFYQRRASKFVATDTTKEPGFASPYHVLLAYKASLPHCSVYKKERVPFLLSEITRLEKEMFDFYGQRVQDEGPKMMKAGTDSNK